MVYVLPLLAFALGLAGGWGTLRARMGRTFAAMALGLLVAGGLLWSAGRQAQGWDGIGYAIWLILGVLPGVIGLSVGGLVGYLRRDRHPG